jgi:hypothetical protein
MDIIDEFQKHAEECRHMARLTRDFESKATWTRMAERWQSLLAGEKARTRQLAEARTRRRHAHAGADAARAA